MMSGVTRLRWTALPAVMLGLGGHLGSVGPVAGADAQAPANSPTTNTLPIVLEYQESAQAVTRWNWPVTLQSTAFKQEPDLGQREVRRGRIELGHRGAWAVPFLWDRTQRKLLLDLNRNGDLTDDPTGVFSCSAKHFSTQSQIFTNIQFHVETQAGQLPVLADLQLYDYGRHEHGRLRVYATVRSYWAGKVTLADREWQLGFIEGPHDKLGSSADGYLLLRPWETRQQRIAMHDGALDAFPFPAKLFFGGQLYQVECTYAPKENQPKYEIRLTGQPAELGELKLPGQFLQRVILKDGPSTAVLESPSGTVNVPVGTYGAYRVQVQKGETGACLESWPVYQGLKTNLVVQTGKPATLVAGGPLTNSVTLKRRGSLLVLHYSLVGAGSGTYRRLNQDHSQPPRFAVYKGGNQIASGKFEFG